MILVGGITDDMNDDDDEVVVVGRTVVGRAVVGVGLSRHPHLLLDSLHLEKLF